MNIYPIQHKHCSKCDQLLSIENFSKDKQKKDGYRSSCKSCKNRTDKLYRNNNTDKIKTIQKNYYEKNKESIILKNTIYKIENKERFNEYNKLYQKAYYSKNKKYKVEYGKMYRSLNKDRRQSTQTKYKEKFPERIRAANRKYEKVRYFSDNLFRLKKNIRTLISQSFRKQGYTKKSKTTQILGCSFELFKEHIEKQFVEGMNWDNRSEWHIDHIIPVSLGKTENEIIALNHYTNLQPLWAIDNLKKGNRV